MHIDGYYSKDIKTVRAATVLTTGYVAGTEVDLVECNQAVLYVDFVIGSLTTAELKVEFSKDGTDWYQEVAQAVSGGTAAESLVEHQFSASGSYRLAIPVMDKLIKVSVKGTGTVTNSSMAVKCQLGTA